MTPGAVVIDGYYVEFEGGPYAGPATLGMSLFDWPLPPRIAVAVEDGKRLHWDPDKKRPRRVKPATLKTVAVYRKTSESRMSLSESRALGRLRGASYKLESRVAA